MFEKGDRVKYLTLCLEDDDYETALAAAGALAILTSVSNPACQKVVEVSDKGAEPLAVKPLRGWGC